MSAGPARMSRLSRSALWCLAVLVVVWSGTAHADVIFILGNNPQPNEENILVGNGTSGATVFGLGQLTNVLIAFSSVTDTLTEPTDQPPRIEAADALVNNIRVSVAGGVFEDLIINPFVGSGNATVTVITNESGGGTGTTVFDYSLGNGNNFLTIVASNGETIASVTIDASSGFSSFNQPRISGASGPSAVPEPTSLTLIGIGLATIAAYCSTCALRERARRVIAAFGRSGELGPS